MKVRFRLNGCTLQYPLELARRINSPVWRIYVRLWEVLVAISLSDKGAVGALYRFCLWFVVYSVDCSALVEFPEGR